MSAGPVEVSIDVAIPPDAANAIRRLLLKEEPELLDQGELFGYFSGAYTSESATWCIEKRR